MERDGEFGILPDGRAVERHRLESMGGVAVDILTLGGVIQRVFAPDRRGQVADVALGFDNLTAYLANPSYLGALIGRCANRIGNGRVDIDGVTYLLSRNSGREMLHAATAVSTRRSGQSRPPRPTACTCRWRARMAIRAFRAPCGSMRSTA